MNGNKKPVVNILSNTRARGRNVRPYIHQLLALSTRNFELGKIVIVCDDLSCPGELTEFASSDSRVELVQEEQSDVAICSMEEKVTQWASICNQGVERALQYKSDYFLYIEADLCFPCDIAELLVGSELDIVAPTVYLGSLFYDSWGFRDLSGKRIRRVRTSNMSNKPTEISSAGSLVLFKSEIFEKGIRFRGPYETGLLVGVCNDARKLGYRTWINPNASVIHPTTLWYEQAWVLSGVNITVSGKTLRIACKEVVDFPYAETLKPLVLKALNAQSRIPGGRYSFAIQKNTESRTLTLEIQDEMPHCDPVFLVIKE